MGRIVGCARGERAGGSAASATSGGSGGGTGKKKRRKHGSKSRGATRAVRWERRREAEHDEAITKGGGNRGDRPS